MSPRVRRNLGWAYLVAGPIIAAVVLGVGWVVAAATGT